MTDTILSLADLQNSNPWDYWRLGTNLVEVAKVHGISVGLPMHFHDEDQWIFVVAGRRRFLLEGELIEVRQGELFQIPAGMPHQPLDEPAGVLSIEAYANPGTLLDTSIFREFGASWRQQAQLPFFPRVSMENQQPLSMPFDTEKIRVAQAAAMAGMTREGYSRAFKRKFGMAPKAYDIMQRLNEAKQLLRIGRPLVKVAVDTGFSDQSHLGKQFRRAFGVAPGLYRSG